MGCIPEEKERKRKGRGRGGHIKEEDKREKDYFMSSGRGRRESGEGGVKAQTVSFLCGQRGIEILERKEPKTG
jgi:hypothetical protein